MYDLIIRNGTIVDGTGAAQHVGDLAITDGVLVQVGGTVRGDAREVIDAERPRRHARLRRRAHPLRRPGDLRRRARPVGEPRRHHRGARLVRHRLRAGPPRGPRPPDRDDGVRRGHPRRRAPRRAALEVGDLPRIPRCHRVAQLLDGRRHADRPRGRAHLRDGRAGRRERGRHQRRHRPMACASCAKGIDAGALGFSTSRVVSHTHGRRCAGARHLRRRGRAVRHRRRDVGCAVLGVPARAVRRRRRRRRGGDQGARLDASPLGRVRPAGVVPPCCSRMQAPDLWRELLDAPGRPARRRRSGPPGRQPALRHAARPHATATRSRARASFARGARTRVGFPRRAGRRAGEARGEGRDPRRGGHRRHRRARTTRWADPGARCRSWSTRSSDDLDYEPTADKSLAARAEAAGVTPAELVLRPHARGRRRRMFVVPFFNYAEGNHDAIYEMLTHPATRARSRRRRRAPRHDLRRVDAHLPALALGDAAAPVAHA